MSQAAKAQEPSMEEILASIRRIIADDDGKPGAKPAEAAAAAPSPAASAPPSPAQPAPEPRALKPDSADSKFAREEAPPPAENKSAPDKPAAVFDLTEAMVKSEPAPLTIESPAPIDDAAEEEPDEPAAHETPMPEPTFETAGAAAMRGARAQYARDLSERVLLSPETSGAIDSAFNSLAHTVLVQNARTLEDLVREMLRPMLKSWLDDNLPGIVERLVRAEIERVSRGR